jgi:2-keto-3-deoxy-6-phosphogluconate aldolase
VLERGRLVAISSRGERPMTVGAIGEALFKSGISVDRGAAQLARSAGFDHSRWLPSLGEKAVIGAGTVLTPGEAEEVASTGARLDRVAQYGPGR